MAVWDLNSNLDVFSMQTLLRGLIYVKFLKVRQELLFPATAEETVLIMSFFLGDLSSFSISIKPKLTILGQHIDHAV